MKSIIWIIGTSATGKATFISYLAGSASDELRHNLGLSNDQIAVVASSLAYTCNSSQLDMRKKRSLALVKELRALSKDTSYNHALIKYQLVDTLDKTIAKVQSLFPECRIRYIELIPPNRKEAHKRLRSKDWWSTEWNVEDFYEQEISRIRHIINNLPAIPDIVIAAATDRYTIKSPIATPKE